MCLSLPVRAQMGRRGLTSRMTHVREDRRVRLWLGVAAVELAFGSMGGCLRSQTAEAILEEGDVRCGRHVLRNREAREQRDAAPSLATCAAL